MAVRLSALCAGCPLLPGRFLSEYRCECVVMNYKYDIVHQGSPTSNQWGATLYIVPYLPTHGLHHEIYIFFRIIGPMTTICLERIRSTKHKYRGCPRRNVPDFGRVFLMLKYADITQNTYVQSWTVTEIMARERCGLLVGPRTVPVSWQALSMFVLECGVVGLYQNAQSAMLPQCLPFLCHV
jgi:hypothetical protein